MSATSCKELSFVHIHDIHPLPEINAIELFCRKAFNFLLELEILSINNCQRYNLLCVYCKTQYLMVRIQLLLSFCLGYSRSNQVNFLFCFIISLASTLSLYIILFCSFYFHIVPQLCFILSNMVPKPLEPNITRYLKRRKTRLVPETISIVIVNVL